MASIYARFKDANGRWGYEKVAQGKPRQNATFHIRFTDAVGRRRWSSPYASAKAAKDDAEGTAIAIKAQSAGLTVAEFSDATSAGKTLVKAAVDSFLKYHRNARPKTVSQYAGALGHLLQHLPKGVRFVGDLATEDALDSYHATLQAEDFAPKTIWVRMGVILSMLKRNATETGVAEPSILVKLTKPVERKAKAYTSKDIDALFEKMDEEEKVRYTFFLHTGCREQEVMFATWSDLDLTNKTFEVTGEGKQDVGFVPKSHQTRTIPLTSKLASMLGARKKSGLHKRWVFVSDNGKPDGHMLRKFKSIAKEAGLNCGECETEITEWHCGTSKKVEASCLTRPVCEKHYLHRLRKTCATRWLRNGINLMDIKTWLGHKSLAVTQIYLEDSTQVDEGLQSKLDSVGV
jgi:integrase/recombinase XerD